MKCVFTSAGRSGRFHDAIPTVGPQKLVEPPVRLLDGFDGKINAVNAKQLCELASCFMLYAGLSCGRKRSRISSINTAEGRFSESRDGKPMRNRCCVFIILREMTLALQ